jgi:hypothetical protein
MNKPSEKVIWFTFSGEQRTQFWHYPEQAETAEAALRGLGFTAYYLPHSLRKQAM